MCGRLPESKVSGLRGKTKPPPPFMGTKRQRLIEPRPLAESKTAIIRPPRATPMLQKAESFESRRAKFSTHTHPSARHFNRAEWSEYLRHEKSIRDGSADLNEASVSGLRRKQLAELFPTPVDNHSRIKEFGKCAEIGDLEVNKSATRRQRLAAGIVRKNMATADRGPRAVEKIASSSLDQLKAAGQTSPMGRNVELRAPLWSRERKGTRSARIRIWRKYRAKGDVLADSLGRESVERMRAFISALRVRVATTVPPAIFPKENADRADRNRLRRLFQFFRQAFIHDG